MKKFGIPKLRCRAIVANFEARREKERAAEIRRWRADVSPTLNAVSMSLLQVLGHFWKIVFFCSLTRSDFADRFDHHFFSFLLFFRLRNEDSCGTKSTVETKSLATGLENGKNRTEMSSSFWVRVRSRTNLFLVLLSGVSSERGKQASLAGLNFGVQPFSHFALAIFFAPWNCSSLFLRRRLSGTGAILVVSYTENANKKTWNKWRLVESKPGNETWSEIRIGWAGRRRESR